MTRPAAVNEEQLCAWAGVPEELASLLSNFCEREGVTMRLLRGESRQYRLVALRRRFAMQAHACGYSSARIGLALNRDHSTILHHLARLAA